MLFFSNIQHILSLYPFICSSVQRSMPLLDYLTYFTFFGDLHVVQKRIRQRWWCEGWKLSLDRWKQIHVHIRATLSPSLFTHFSLSRQHPQGALISKFCLGFISVHISCVNVLSLFCHYMYFLLHVSSVPFQQIIKKRESSSINIAPVSFFFLLLSLWESGDWACAESLLLIFYISACLHVFLSQRVCLCGHICL